MIGKLTGLTYNMDGSQNVTFTVQGDLRETADAWRDRDLEISAKPWHKRRSLSANAYFHLLVNKIAEKTQQSDDDVKAELVVRYGTYSRNADGTVAGVMLPTVVDIAHFYPYVRLFDQRMQGGKLFNCYLFYKQTHEMDSAEMSRLIDGTVSEAKELGIDTMTPEQLKQLRYGAERAEKKWRS